MTHPDGTVYNYAFDAMGRLNTMSLSGGSVVAQVNGYGVAGQITSMSYDGVQETRAYNDSLQLTRLTATRTEIQGQTRTLMDMEYRFSANQNNGRIESSKDYISGEDIAYQYDGLNRLVTAGAETYVYDGFGNMTSKAGVAISINAATNHAATGYDANGAYIGGYLQGLQAYEYQYNGENRLTRDNNLGRDYEYDPYGKRIMAKLNASTEHVYFYEGTGGRRLATYGRNRSDGTLGHLSSDLTFAGKLIRQYHTVVVDRLGSVRWRSVERGGQAWQVGGEVLRYRPYGDEVTPTGNYRDKFGTYLRDESGFDYADQRYYDSGKGRFLTVDPYEASGGAGEPGSWNRYSYIGGDPVNYYDPKGLFRRCPAGSTTGPDGKSCVGNMVDYSFEDDDGSGTSGGSASEPAKGEPPPGGAPPPGPCIGGDLELPSDAGEAALVRRVYNENSYGAVGQPGWDLSTGTRQGDPITLDTLKAENLALASTVVNRARATNRSLQYAATTQAAGVGRPLWSAARTISWNALFQPGSAGTADCDNLLNVMSAVSQVLAGGPVFSYLSWRGTFGLKSYLPPAGADIFALTVFFPYQR